MKYIERLTECEKRSLDSRLSQQERERWKIAVDVYRHLIKCNGSHSLVTLTGNKKRCAYFDKY